MGANPLVQELEKVTNEILYLKEQRENQEEKGSSGNTEASINEWQSKWERNLNRLCYLLEKTLEHGLKESLWTTTYSWNYLENLDQSLPGNEVKDFIRRLRETAKTSLGRGRLFIRVALNEGSFSDYLNALVWNKPLTEDYYRDSAILRREDSNQVLSLIEQLKSVPFHLNINDRTLDNHDYWQRVVDSRRRNINTVSGQEGIDYSTFNGLSTTTKRLGENAPQMQSPNGGNSIPLTKETFKCLIEQSENQAKELEESRRMILELKVQLEMERKDKETKVKHYVEEVRNLNDKLRDLQIELSIYKSNYETNGTSNGDHISMMSLEEFDSSFAEESGETDEQEGQQTENHQVIETLEKVSRYIKQMKEHDASMKERILSSNVITATSSIQVEPV